MKRLPPGGVPKAGSISNETWREAIAAGKSWLDTGPEAGTLLHRGWPTRKLTGLSMKDDMTERAVVLAGTALGMRCRW